MFLILFSSTLLIANIYCFFKKKYLYLFIPCMLFLPEYYGIELSNSLPILTVSRIMYIVFYFYAFIHHKRRINVKKALTSPIPKHYLILVFYFILRILSNLYYITSSMQAAKTILSIVFEQLLLLIALYCLFPSRGEIDTTIKCIVWSAAILFIIGIIESTTYLRPFDSLYTVSRVMLNEHYVRMGLLRSVTTMGMPGRFSNVCLLILPLSLYLFNVTGKYRYIGIIFLDILAGIHSGARAYFFFIALIFLFYTVLAIRSQKTLICHARGISIILAALIITVVVSSAFNPYLKYYYTGYAKSLLNEVGFDFDLDADAPDGVMGYGQNAKTEEETGGITSRLVQLSGIEYSLMKNPLFGLGNDAISKHKIQYFRLGKWRDFNSVDLGLVEIIMFEGILGLLGYFCLFIFILLCINFKHSTAKDYLLILLTFSYLLTTLSTSNMQNYLILIAAYAMLLEKGHVFGS